MASGLEVYTPAGALSMDGAGRYARIIEIIDITTVGTSGSRNYVDVSANDLDFVLFQGNNIVLSVIKTGTTISWGVTDTYYFGALSGAAMIIVVSY